MRSHNHGTISWALISIPVKFYAPVDKNVAKGVEFNLLHRKCGGRLKQQLTCPACAAGESVPDEDQIRGYRVGKDASGADQYVTFDDDELSAMQPGKSEEIAIDCFVERAAVGDTYIESVTWLGPDGANKPYELFARAMARTGRVAIATYTSRGRRHLCMIAPYAGGLAMYRLYRSAAVRDFAEVGYDGAAVPVSADEVAMAERLIRSNVSAFEPERYVDDYAAQVSAAADVKLAGKQTVSASPLQPATHPAVRDLMEALRLSLGDPKLAAESKPAAAVVTNRSGAKRTKSKTAAKTGRARAR